MTQPATPVAPSTLASSDHAGGELPKAYVPLEAEGLVRERWNTSRAFHAVPSQPALHLGHAFNNALQDLLTRYYRMKGANTLWLPGTDHAGIATQTVVEKRLLLQGKRRTDFTLEQFVGKVQEWKDEYEATILSQLTAMGCSCDFERTRFTMDETCAIAVRAGVVSSGVPLRAWGVPLRA